MTVHIPFRVAPVVVCALTVRVDVVGEGVGGCNTVNESDAELVVVAAVDAVPATALNVCPPPGAADVGTSTFAVKPPLALDVNAAPVAVGITVVSNRRTMLEFVGKLSPVRVTSLPGNAEVGDTDSDGVVAGVPVDTV